MLFSNGYCIETIIGDHLGGRGVKLHYIKNFVRVQSILVTVFC